MTTELKQGNRCVICGHYHIYSPSEQIWFGQDINKLSLGHINHFKDILIDKAIQEIFLAKFKAKHGEPPNES